MTKKKDKTSPDWGGARTPAPGKKLGPPALPPEQKAQKIAITIDPALLQWIDGLGDNRSQTIGRLLAASREYLAQE